MAKHPFNDFINRPRPRVVATGMHALSYGDGTIVIAQRNDGTVKNETWRYQKR